MKVDHVLILAAGKGTRMGNIGKVLPKVTWPIFEKSLLELQVAYARRLAPDAKIYINVYNYSSEIISHINNNPDSFLDVEILHEKKTLDIGGAIHNLGSVISYNGVLLVLNSDQFMFCEPELVDNSLKKLDHYESLLFTYEVNSSDGYNALKIENDQFFGITKNSEIVKNSKIITYTGMSLINLKSLKRLQGESKFFESVCNPKAYKVGVEQISEFEYWDFGTSERYYISMKNVLNNTESDFYSFLVREKSLKEKLIDKKTYNSKIGIKLKDIYIHDKVVCYKNSIYNYLE